LKDYLPRYIELYKSGELFKRVEKLKGILEACNLCPHNCGVNRLKEEKGFCKTGSKMIITCYGKHWEEEKELVGTGGSGMIFFSFCSMRCVFCQNYDLSHFKDGEEETPERLAEIMLELQQNGCHNINLVSPTHVIPQIVEAIYIAVPKGLTIPIVYNTGGYENEETLKLLDGIITIYMPDFKFFDSDEAYKYTNCKNYSDVTRAAMKEMYRQVGDMVVDDKNIAVSGLLIRYLVMPDFFSDAVRVIDFIAEQISRNTMLDIMGQYEPAYKAFDYTKIARKTTKEELMEVVKYAKEKGLVQIIASE